MKTIVGECSKGISGDTKLDKVKQAASSGKKLMGFATKRDATGVLR